MHTPVLLKEVIEGLQVREGGLYIDATVGEGGHTDVMLAQGARVLGFDRDERQIEKLRKSHTDGNLQLVNANFSDIAKIAEEHGFAKVDGIVFDLGLSWGQLSTYGKGLSYRNEDEPLDMRLDRDGELTAENILNTYGEDELYDLFARNSEEVRAKDIAHSIFSYRKTKRYKTVGDLKRTIEKVMGPNTGKTNSRIFQALRIEVNDEFASLKKGLQGAVSLLKPEGKVAVISFHSLEDRIVKQYIRTHGFRQVSKKAIAGDRKLSFERPARLRIFSL